MQENRLPHYDMTVNTTGCCPRFDPAGWDGQVLHFNDKPFLRAITRSENHVPQDMAEVFARVNDHMQQAGAFDPDNFIVLSHDPSAESGEHFFAVGKPVPDEEMVELSGDFVTKVFDGPYRDGPRWQAEMEALVRGRGGEPDRIFFFYTTCPKCAEAYGHNYVVGVAEIPAPAG